MLGHWLTWPTPGTDTRPAKVSNMPMYSPLPFCPSVITMKRSCHILLVMLLEQDKWVNLDPVYSLDIDQSPAKPPPLRQKHFPFTSRRIWWWLCLASGGNSQNNKLYVWGHSCYRDGICELLPKIASTQRRELVCLPINATSVFYQYLPSACKVSQIALDAVATRRN